MLPMMLAALFHHFDWVKTNVAPQHPIFGSNAVKLLTAHRHLLRLDPAWLDDHNKSARGMSVSDHLTQPASQLRAQRWVAGLVDARAPPAV